jgi:AcrR family transcriptional regulator
MPDEPHGRGGFEAERFEPESLAGLPAGYALRPLPVGRHGLTRAQVVRNQRMRMIGAMLAVLPQHGYPAITIGHLASAAGVSRAAFYAQFESKEECFLATYDMARGWLCERVEQAAASSAEWPERVRGGVGTTLQLLAANPALARLFAIDAAQAGEAARERQRAFLARYGDALRGGRRDDLALPHELEEMLLGGVLTTVARYVESGRTKRLPEAVDEVVQYLLIPYLGVTASRRVVDEAA